LKVDIPLPQLMLDIPLSIIYLRAGYVNLFLAIIIPMGMEGKGFNKLILLIYL
jgi:hypothetical protein